MVGSNRRTRPFGATVHRSTGWHAGGHAAPEATMERWCAYEHFARVYDELMACAGAGEDPLGNAARIAATSRASGRARGRCSSSGAAPARCSPAWATSTG